MIVKFKKEQIRTRRVDILVAEKISVELMAIIQLEDIYLAQAMSYMKLIYSLILVQYDY